MPVRPALRLAVLVSGRGSNLGALVDAARRGELPVVFAGVFSDRPACAALALAAREGLPTVAMEPALFPTREQFDAALFDAIDAVQPDLIVCAGYMRIISTQAVQRTAGRMINIHPSLLPRHPGLRTHAQVLAAGDAFHGASVHQVVPEVDAGPVLAQARVPVGSGDTVDSLAQRILSREHPLLVRTIRAIAEGELSMNGAQWRFRGTPLHVPLSLNDQDELEEAR